jgi:ATP/maltotriose-dependent transcriptional regulator MalT
VAAVDDEDFEEARRLAEESLTLLREAGDERGAVMATRTLAFTYHSCGDLERARGLHESNLGQARALGFKDIEITTLGTLGMIAFEQGRIEDALTLGRQNLLASRDLGSLQAIAQSLCRSAVYFAALPGKADTAARLLSCFDALREQIGVSDAAFARMNEQTLSAIHAQLDKEAFAEAWEQGRTLKIDQAAALALESLETRPLG